MIFYYNKSYFLKFTANKQSLQLRHAILYYFFKTVILLVLFFLLIFRKLVYKHWKFFTMIFLITVVFLIFIEIGTRVYICYFAPPGIKSLATFTDQCGRVPRYEPHHYLDYKLNEEYKYNGDMHNSLGFRGPEIRENPEYRIVVMGASVVYGTAIDTWKESFPAQLEKELRSRTGRDIEVINAGVGGYSSWETLISLEFQILDLNPDLIIIHNGANDINARLVNPNEYKADNSGMRKIWEKPKLPLIFHSMFLRYLMRTHTEVIFDYVEKETSGAAIEGSGYIRILNGTLMETLKKNKPIYFERNLRNTIAIAKENNIKIMLSTIALNKNMTDFFQNQPHYQYGLKENSDVIKEVGKSNNSPVYDFASEMIYEDKYFTDGVHMTAEGEKMKAKLFADYLINNKILT